MEIIKIRSIISTNGQLLIKDMSFKKGKNIDALLIYNTENEKKGTFLTGKELAISDMVGIWKDKNISDSLEYTISLREKLQKRKINNASS